MKLGLGLYSHMLTRENFRFAKQAGATHVVAHLASYATYAKQLSASASKQAPGQPVYFNKPWDARTLTGVRKSANAEGLELAAIENFDPGQWYDILLDGPKRARQIEIIKTSIENAGKSDIHAISSLFSIAGVAGRLSGLWARGKARSVAYLGRRRHSEGPLPLGQIWNVVYDSNAKKGHIKPVSEEVMWDRLKRFLDDVVPTAEKYDVTLSFHPDDPPVPKLRNASRLLYNADNMRRFARMFPSKHVKFTLCVGTVSEMRGTDVYSVVDEFSRMGKISYVHFRNVKGKVPNYREVFIDEGDTDMIKVMLTLHRNNFDGVLIPDHAPQMSCDSPWHSGMSFTLGYMGAIVRAVENGHLQRGNGAESVIKGWQA